MRRASPQTTPTRKGSNRGGGGRVETIMGTVGSLLMTAGVISSILVVHKASGDINASTLSMKVSSGSSSNCCSSSSRRRRRRSAEIRALIIEPTVITAVWRMKGRRREEEEDGMSDGCPCLFSLSLPFLYCRGKPSVRSLPPLRISNWGISNNLRLPLL